jgi:cytochrome c peroxidase
MGVAKNYFMEHRTLITPADLGLFEVTKNIKDLSVFKVPSLRNIAMRAPYYHDGSVKSLDEAVVMMGKYQLGIAIPDNDVKAIVAYMKSLTAKSSD